MKGMFFPKLAWDGLKKNRQTWFPYLLACALTVATDALLLNLSANPSIRDMKGAATLQSILSFGGWIAALFSIIFLFYTHRFLIRRRLREFALFNILGMEKRHIARILLWEGVFTFLLGGGLGLCIGIALDKAMFLLLERMLGASATLGFYISWETLFWVLALYLAIITFCTLNGVRKIAVSSPLMLLRSASQGERPPKTRGLLALIGALCLGAGYYLSFTTENPITALPVFFEAVVLVIIGTYLSFLTGSVALLRLLQKNRRYYYRTKHMVSVSGLLYRMRQNAMGLGNICILSTMVLVTVSTTTALMFGANDVIARRYPYAFNIQIESKRDEAELLSVVREAQRAQAIDITFETSGRQLDFAAFLRENELEVRAIAESYGFDWTRPMSSMESTNEVKEIYVFPLEDYNRALGTNYTLGDDEILLLGNSLGSDWRWNTLRIFDQDWIIRKIGLEYPDYASIEDDVFTTLCLVVPSEDVFFDFERAQRDIYGEFASAIDWCYVSNCSNPAEEQLNVEDQLWRTIIERLPDAPFQFASQQYMRTEYMSTFGGLFFIGVFLGMLFMLAAALTLYYKQISEGYEDRERFLMLERVGMTPAEVRSAIRAQVLLIFFLPLVVAGCHTLGAFPITLRMLNLLLQNDVKLYLQCTLGCIAAFAILYTLFYIATAKVYEHIVQAK
ncbi:MAG: ABC transporter permease [Clostridia bacterium]|nr:ABC transporter permease [Clostridia bacterium]